MKDTTALMHTADAAAAPPSWGITQGCLHLYQPIRRWYGGRIAKPGWRSERASQ